ncbi:MAG: hypothetical protein WC475_03080 [Candidatus Paceibacterota bacterium]
MVKRKKEGAETAQKAIVNNELFEEREESGIDDLKAIRRYIG